MARILLGVSGGIAAYKALEFVRLATAAGHEVRVVQTPASRRFVGEASFAALTGAPVLSERVRARSRAGGLPRPAAADARAAQPSAAGGKRRGLPDRPGLGEHHRQARQRTGRQPAEQLRAGRHMPAGHRPGDEQPHVRAPGHAREPADAARARREHRRAGRRAAGLAGESRASGAWPSPPSCWPRARRRSPAAHGLRARAPGAD